MINPGSDETVTKVRKIILYVILGILIIWFAYWIVALVIKTISGSKLGDTRVPIVYAQTQIRHVDFESYANRIKGMRVAINSSYDPDVMAELGSLLDGAYQHLPDGDEHFVNKNNYENIKLKIADYNQHRDTLSRGSLQLALDDFFNEVYAPEIVGKIVASPTKGAAPLSVTFDAREVSDESGNVIGENNYVWWMKDSSAGPQILGR